MKAITIFQDGGHTIFVNDDDDSDLKEYTKKISSILTYNNISVLYTTSGSVIIRPSKILSIRVEEIKIRSDEEDKSKEKSMPVEEDKKEEPIDIITDGD